MINPNKLIKIARKWQRVAALRRKRISTPRVDTSPVEDKGHFVVYINDQRRFVFPISYLSNRIFQELLRIHLHEALLMSVAMSRCSQSLSQHHYGQTSQQLLVCSC
ncbi:hypothetical protein ACOSQ2_031919 [Xanthoceras sorbifolium]